MNSAKNIFHMFPGVCDNLLEEKMPSQRIGEFQLHKIMVNSFSNCLIDLCSHQGNVRN